MNTPPQVLVNVYTPEPTLHPADQPLLYADDLAAVRGDGVFETMLVRDGHVCNLERHRTRFQRSAQMLNLPAPDLERWDKATELALAQWGSSHDGSMRWVYSRGRESTGQQTGFIMLNPLSATQQERAGLRVMTAQKGFSIDYGNTSPWALIGAKTLSYAANMAALRYAKEHGLDDLIFISAEGNVLEGPTSTVIAVRGRTLLTPTPGEGILSGTTQAALFAEARNQGWECVETSLTVADLLAADGVWLVSSVRLAARVVEIDGAALPQRTDDSAIEQLVAAALATE